MKLVRYGPAGSELPGIFDGRVVLDLSAEIEGVTSDVLESGWQAIRDLHVDRLPVVEGNPRLGSPVDRISKIICVGLNYKDHAAESGMEAPREPILFMKAASTVSGPNDCIGLPPEVRKADWEVELGVVIGRSATRVPESTAIQHVAGYVVVNDLSEREYQLEHGGQWVKGKSLDTFCPVGPWLVTPDELPDPHSLHMWLEVNGERRQESSTSNMIFGVPFLISYISRYMTLQPGDLICTGTPAGVGLGQTPPVYLKAGDVVELGIECLGVQKQRVVQLNW